MYLVRWTKLPKEEDRDSIHLPSGIIVGLGSTVTDIIVGLDCTVADCIIGFSYITQ